MTQLEVNLINNMRAQYLKQLMRQGKGKKGRPARKTTVLTFAFTIEAAKPEGKEEDKAESD